MNVFKIILVFLSSFSFSSQQDILKGKFKNLKTFDQLLPEHIGAYLVPIFKSTLFGCTSKCLIHALCEGFLFDSISNDCGLLRCSLLGLQTTALESPWRYFSSINICGFGWSLYNNHCYLYNESMTIWMDAEVFCESLGGYLLEIQDKEENEWITQKMLKADVCSVKSECSTWCGGRKRTVTQYSWSHSSKDLSYTNWAPNQPFRYDPCINIRHSGKWNDAQCDDLFKFICEKPLQISQAVALDDKK